MVEAMTARHFRQAHDETPHGVAVRLTSGLRVIVLAALSVGMAGGGLRAADDQVAEPADAAGRVQAGNQVDLGVNFDANVFEQQGGWVLRGGVGAGRVRITVTGVEQISEAPTFERARTQAEARLARVDRLCDLTDAQRRALRLAIESDIRRLVERIDVQREKYLGVSVNMADPEGQKVWQTFQQDVQQCRRWLLELFDTGSLFSAVLGSTLDADQTARLEAETRVRRTFRWRALVETGLVKLDDAIGLSAEQHASLEAMLLAHEPPLRIEGLPRQTNAHAEQMLVYLTLSRVDQKALQAAVSPRQWRALAMFVNQGKAMQSWLEQQNLLEPQQSNR